jgi:hypothetical protein
LIYTSIIIGVTTYIIVFHLNSLTYQTSVTYTPIRNKIINEMKHSVEEHWASKGSQFAAFRPKQERKKPSEWWITIFWIRQLYLTTYRFLLCRPAQEHSATNTIPHITVIDDHPKAADVEPTPPADFRDRPNPTVMKALLSIPNAVFRRGASAGRDVNVDGDGQHRGDV